GQETALRLLQRDTILRALRPRQAWFDRCEVQLDGFGVDRIRIAGAAEHALRPGVRFDERDLLGLAAGELPVVERHLVERENRDRRAVLGTHVSKRGAIRDREVLEARA